MSIEMIKVKTPCVGVCSTALGGSVCRGCKRFAHEVIDWNSYSEEQKAIIEARLSQALTTLIKNKLLIIDEALLEWQLSQQPIDVPKHRNLFCQAYVLLKAGATQITDLSQFGLALYPAFKTVPLKQLCLQIDEEFYALSQAQYEHCFVDFS